MSAERYYIGTSNIPAGTSEYYQNDDVVESVADISFIASLEIWD